MGQLTSTGRYIMCDENAPPCPPASAMHRQPVSHVSYDSKWHPSYQNWPDPFERPPIDPQLYYHRISSSGAPHWIRGDGMDFHSASNPFILASVHARIPGRELARHRAFMRWVYNEI